MKFSFADGRLIFAPENIPEAFALARLLNDAAGYDLRELVDPVSGVPAVEVGVRQRPGPRKRETQAEAGVSTGSPGIVGEGISNVKGRKAGVRPPVEFRADPVKDVPGTPLVSPTRDEDGCGPEGGMT